MGDAAGLVASPFVVCLLARMLLSLTQREFEKFMVAPLKFQLMVELYKTIWKEVPKQGNEGMLLGRHHEGLSS